MLRRHRPTSSRASSEPNGAVGGPVELPALRESRLSNGLSVITIENPCYPVTSYYTFYGVGSRNEQPGRTGISHLFEHMMFNGSRRYPASAFDVLLERSGGTSNAYTTEDVTVFMDDFPETSLELIVRLESDRMSALELNEVCLESEREVVKEERRQTVDDSPIGLLFEELQAAIYRSHPYRWPVIGWMDDLDRIDLSACQNYYERFYRPDNATVVVAGAVRHDPLLELMGRHYDPAASRLPMPPPPAASEVALRGETRVDVAKATELPLLALGWLTPPADHEDIPALDVLQELLAGGESSCLEKRLVRGDGSTLAVQAGVPWKLGPSFFYLLAECDPSKGSARVLAALDDELSAFPSRLQDDEIRRAVTRLQARFYGQLTHNGGTADLVGTLRTYGSSNPTVHAARLASVTRDDVLRAFHRWLDTDARVVARTVPPRIRVGESMTRLAPKTEPVLPDPADPDDLPGNSGPLSKGPGRAGASATAALPPGVRAEHVPRVSLNLSRLRLPAIELFDGPHGMRVVHVRDSRLPLTSLRLLSRAAAVTDPDGRSGLSRLTADLRTLGAAELDAESLAVTVDDLGGSLASSVGRESCLLQLSTLSSGLPRAIELMAAMEVEPTFASEHFERERGLLRSDALGIADRPSERADVGFWQALFPDHPYGRRPGGLPGDLYSITLDDVHDHHRRRSRASDSVLVVSGDIEMAAARDLVARAFEDWSPKGTNEPLTIPDTVFPKGRNLTLEVANDLEQCHVVIGGPGFRIGDPSAAAIELANNTLGGAFTSRLNDRLRVELGLTYGATSAAASLSRRSPFLITFSTSHRRLGRAIHETLNLLERFRREGPTDHELAAARAYTRGQYLDRVQTVSSLAAQIGACEFHGLGPNYPQTHFDALGATGADAVREAADRMPSDDLLLYVVGPASAASDLKAIAPLKVVDQNIS